MQPVQFQCGHCGKLMAVSSQYLGQQVRCPHCQQVVIAPPPAPAQTSATPTPPAPSEGLADTVMHTPSPAGGAEDIFSAPNDLFSYSQTPRLDLPGESLPPTLAGDSAVAAPEQSQPTLGSTLPWAGQQQAAEPPAPLAPFGQSENTAVLPGGVPPPWSSDARTETLPPPPVQVPFPDARSEPAATSTHTAKQTETKAPWFLLLVFCPLLLYSIVISIFAFFIYRHDQQLRELFQDRFDKMPDVGDDPGVRKGKKVSFTDRYKPEFATQALPEYLCTTLGKPLRVGQLQVKANRVERQRVSIVVESSRPEPCPNDSLVLYLDLKNLSDDYAFAPLDNYFDRYWRPGVDMVPPLTLLEVGKELRFYGGPAHWYPRGDRNNRREWVKGRREGADRLQPGEEKEMFVCTDGSDDKAATVLFGQPSGEGHRGSFLWRVRVRRGLVRVGEKDYSATAVIGVRFSSSDIRQAASDVQ